MTGIQHIKVSNQFVSYQFDLYRNITIVSGHSATGKTTLFNLIADYSRDPVYHNGVNLSSTSPCVALTDQNWEYQLKGFHNSIVFVDEDAKYISGIEFARAVKDSSNYYVIFSREALHNLPYSVNEIYEISKSGKYHKFKRRYKLTESSEFSPSSKRKHIDTEVILTEDSQSGFQFFEAVSEDLGIECASAGANSAIFNWMKDNISKSIAVICDGAAFGAEIDRVSKLAAAQNMRLIMPESFEWLILKSGIIDDVDAILERPSDYIESKDFFSWENYFTHLLIARTVDTYRQYSKAVLNQTYLHPKEKKAILSQLPEFIETDPKNDTHG